MSVSLLSVESIVDTANRFYRKDAPLIYSQSYHIPLLLDIIGYVTHEHRFPVAVTTVPLIEPIYNLDKTIILSKGLIAFYMNQPIKIDHGTVKIERNVDLFGDLHATVERATGCFHPSPRDTLVDRFDENTHVRFAHLVRLIMMVAHWQQHYVRSIPFNSHDHFKRPQLARRDVTVNDRQRYGDDSSGDDDPPGEQNNDSESDHTDDDDRPLASIAFERRGKRRRAI